MNQIPFTPPLVAAALMLLFEAAVIGASRLYFVGTGKWTYRDIQPGQNHGPRWYASLNRVYINGIEAFALFAPACILLALTQSPYLALVSVLGWVFVLGRAAHALLYILLGYRIWISLSWMVGFAATLILWLLMLA